MHLRTVVLHKRTFSATIFSTLRRSFFFTFLVTVARLCSRHVEASVQTGSCTRRIK